jgi:hypothetical protein
MHLGYIMNLDTAKSDSWIVQEDRKMHNNCKKNIRKGKSHLSRKDIQKDVALIYQLFSQLRTEIKTNMCQARTEARKEIDRNMAMITSQTNEKLAQTEIKLIKIIVTVIGVSVVIPGFLAIWIGQ